MWWLRADSGAIDARLLPGATLAWSRWPGGGFGLDPSLAYEERRLDGTLVTTYATVGTPTDHHDLELLPNGNALLQSYRRREGVDLRPHGPAGATVVDGEIQEIAPNGQLVWSWNTKDHIDLAETGRWWQRGITDQRTGQPIWDIVHLNSVEQEGDTIVFSARHLDAVYGISRSTGAVLWKLGGTTRPESLTVLGDAAHGSSTFGGQHDARLLGDGTLTVYDNATGHPWPPRAVRFRLDTAAGTATVIEELSDPDVQTSFCCGSARRLAGGNWVIGWGGPPITELDSSGGRAFSLRFEGVFSYRTVPVPGGQLDRAALRDGMDAMKPRR